MPNSHQISPQFLEGTSGPLFAMLHEPHPDQARSECMIIVPPFAEEMNRSRRVLTLQAQALSNLGFTVLLLDLFGTGDSGGEFAEATWSQWLSDIRTATDWVERERGDTVGLLGLRLGASLAVIASRTEPERYSRLVMWDPVVRGDRFLTQVLRTRVAAAMGSNEAERETTTEMRARIADGDSLEVGGYVISPVLAAALDTLDLSTSMPNVTSSIHWLETATEDNRPLSTAALRVIEAWKNAGLDIVANAVTAPRFWSLIETTLAPGLVEATSRLLEGTRA